MQTLISVSQLIYIATYFSTSIKACNTNEFKVQLMETIHLSKNQLFNMIFIKYQVLYNPMFLYLNELDATLWSYPKEKLEMRDYKLNLL